MTKQAQRYGKLTAEQKRKIDDAKAAEHRFVNAAQADYNSGRISADTAQKRLALARENRDRKIAAAKGHKAAPKKVAAKYIVCNGRVVKV